ncbi:carbon-nitrogen hydrolase family protein [Amorphus sp. 3PC139-8]|uniref:carbon-nitrogen hydrolase family protein n=1 Tax=Amorphus sp. 3PC139-8 TaxID=2735676 RepID=UPI00345D2870
MTTAEAEADGTVCVAAIQMRGTTDAAQNGDEAERLIREAARQGAVYVQTPEITNLVDRDGARMRAAMQTEADDPTLARLSALARDLGIHIHIGSLALKEGDAAVNRGFLVGPDGSVLARYDKIHMFDVDLPDGESWRESRTYRPGEKAVAVALPFAGLGMTICYDVRFPVLYRALAVAGADILTVPACFTKQTGEAHWHVLTRARAIETGSFLIAATQGGHHEDGRDSYGHAIVVDPWGKVLAEGDTDPCVVVADLDLTRVAAARRRIPALANARTFEKPETIVRAEANT